MNPNVATDEERPSITRQILVGSSCGWLTGFVIAKGGKIAAIALGGGIILLQVANHNGYVTIHWDRVNEMGDRMKACATRNCPELMNQVKRFSKEKIYMAAGYAGGFLLGIASA